MSENVTVSTDLVREVIATLGSYGTHKSLCGELREALSKALSKADSPSSDAARLAEELRQAEAEIAELRENIVVREARRLEILEWWQTFTSTGWECENCRHSTYHAHANECAECGTPFPHDNLMAFKLGAGGTDDREFLDRAARDLYGVSFAELRNNAPAIVTPLGKEK